MKLIKNEIWGDPWNHMHTEVSSDVHFWILRKVRLNIRNQTTQQLWEQICLDDDDDNF